MDSTLIHGNTKLAFESGPGDSLIPNIYHQRETGEVPALRGESFLSIRIGDQRVPAAIKRASAGDMAEFTGEFPGMDDWQIQGRIVPAGDMAERLEWRIQIAYLGEDPIECGFHIAFRVPDSGVPRWMVPAMFYKHNRPESCVRRYPRYAFEGGNPNEFVSNYWAFRSDRSSCPSVFCWTDNLTTCLATREPFSHGDSGVGFRGDSSGTFLMLNYPYVEEPVKYSFIREDANAPEALDVTVMPREAVQIAFSTMVDERDIHAYDGLIRDIYNASEDETNPWVSMEEAEELLAYGLHRWHYDPEQKALYETCAFDKYFGKGAGQVDRPHMHVAWVSGAPYAFALWKYGERVQNTDYTEAGLMVLNKIADEGISPCGLFYPEWTQENGWGTGWNPKPEWIQARTVSEATWFYFQALEYAKGTPVGARLVPPAEVSQAAQGTPLQGGGAAAHPNWAEAAKKNLEFALKVQREDGNFGSYYNINSGQCEEWDGAGGIMWIPALLAGAKYSGNTAYRDAAIKAGEYYKRFIEDEYIYGAPEDVHLTPTSEDAYNALIACVHLYEATQDEKWLELAQYAADLVATFRWTYNTQFADDTILGKYDFRTLGADIASPSNNHLHNYGLICHPELLRLWQYTGDTYYLSRAADHLACFHQFIARSDGDFNARKGMITEQWFHTDWTHAKGSMLQLAHSWCAGLILYADMYTHGFGDIVIDADSREVYVFDSSWIESTEEVDDDLVLTLVNPSMRDQTLTVRHSKLGMVGEVTVPASDQTRVRVYSREARIEELAGEDEAWP